MPQRTPRAGKSIFDLLFLTAALSLLSAGVRRDRVQLPQLPPEPAGSLRSQGLLTSLAEAGDQLARDLDA